MMKVLWLPTWGSLVRYIAGIVSLVVIFYLCEKVVLVDRRAFTCKKCGYDLQGLTENRCPECGTAFDPAERERIMARVDPPPPNPRHIWLAVLIVVLLALAIVAGLIVWDKASVTAAKRAAVPATPTGPPTSRSGV
ncbi:MAG TPA: hypothetical protein VMV94_16300 [Phycisphaerae bacterium]|nr:hypothetical protein [Phycisphaerae bacterium]